MNHLERPSRRKAVRRLVDYTANTEQRSKGEASGSSQTRLPSLGGIGYFEAVSPHPIISDSPHLVFHGRRPVLVSKKNGEDLEIRVPPDHPLIGEFLRFFKHLVGREFAPVRHVRVAVINGRSALESPCAKALIEIGFHRDHNSLALRRRY